LTQVAIDVNLGPMLLKRRLASLFLAAVLAFPSATALAQSAEQQERIAASFVLALGRTPTAVEIERWAKQEPLSLADLVARHRRQLQGDAATERAVIVKASQDAFGVAPGEDDIKSLSGGGTYADLMQRHLRWLAEHPTDYDQVVHRAYRLLLQRDAYPLEIDYCLVFGAVAIFTYVGAEVSIGSFLVNFMSRPEIGGLTESAAGKYLSLYWGGAMVGRFIGAAVLRKVKPGYVLAFNASVVTLLLALAMTVGGGAAMVAVIAIGLFNSIMFPTIFTLAIDGLGPRTGEGSGVLCMAIVGGAIVPVVQGYAADHIGILLSFIVPLVCYLYIVHYGLKGHQTGAAATGSR
jgi:hypothetical protein